MEKETWKVGTHPSTVVSDKKIQNTNFPSPPNSRESEDDETEYYGGYLICESVGNSQIAKLIAAAPAMKYALLEARKEMQTKGITTDNADLYNIIDLAIKQSE